jgi:Zn-dependent peptidase ImmA (M78 family)/transcriptional regulator with XRE-family HTH domain
MSEFIGNNLRLARQFHDLSLTDLGEQLGCSKQFLSRIETGTERVSPQLEQQLVERLQVLPEFFYHVDPMPIVDEQCHFRKQLTTKVALRQAARARGEMLKRLVSVLDERLQLPEYKIFEAEPSSTEEIERAAERCRVAWGLGFGPLMNVTRIAENAGAVVMRVSGLAEEIDAVSFATRRPVIALNATRRSACRGRFAVAHELGHFALHTGVLTGDRLTETQANRFSSALLMPRSSFAPECAKALRGTRINWSVMSDLKLRWGVSKAAILYRGRQLNVFNDDQLRGGYITLKRHGEALQEAEDHLIEIEQPEVIADGLSALHSHLGLPHAAVAREMCVQPAFLSSLLDDGCQPVATSVPNVIKLFGARSV